MAAAAVAARTAGIGAASAAWARSMPGVVPLGENGVPGATGVRGSSWVQLPAPRLLCSMPAARSAS